MSYHMLEMLRGWVRCQRCQQRCYGLDAWGECPSCAWLRQRYNGPGSTNPLPPATRGSERGEPPPRLELRAPSPTSPPVHNGAKPDAGRFGCATCKRLVPISPGHRRLYCSGRCRTRAYRKRLKEKWWQAELAKGYVKPARTGSPTHQNLENTENSAATPLAVTSQKVPKTAPAPTRMQARVQLQAATYAWAWTVAQLTHHTLSELVELSVRRYVRAVAKGWPTEYLEHLPKLQRYTQPRVKKSLSDKIGRGW